MSKENNNNGYVSELTEEMYSQLRDAYLSASSEEEKQQIIWSIVRELYNEMYNSAKRIVRVTSFEETTPSSLLENTLLKVFFPKRADGMSPLERCQTLRHLLALFRKAIYNVMVDRYRYSLRNGIPISFEGNLLSAPEAVPIANDLIIRDMAHRLWDILKQRLDPDSLDLLIMRFNLKLSFPEIAKILDDSEENTLEWDTEELKKRADLLRKRVVYMLKRIRQWGEIKVFIADNQ